MQKEMVRKRLEDLLLAHPGIGDCAVMERRDVRGEARTLAFVVKTAPVTDNELRALLAASGAHAGWPDVFVPVSSIPLTVHGTVDEDRLASLDLADAHLAARWAAEVKAMSAVTHAAALVQRARPISLPLHLLDVLPNEVDSRSSHSETARCVAPPPAIHAATSTVPALADGGMLDESVDEPTLLGDTLIRAAGVLPPKGIVYVESETPELQTYSCLLEEAERILAGLRAAVHPGDPVVLQLAKHRDFLAAFWACILGGFLPVPLAVPPSYDKPSAPMQSLAGVWDTLGRPAVIMKRSAQPDFCRAASRLGLSGVRALVMEDLRREPDPRRHEADPGDIALLMLTSGSTGAPKAVALTHRNLLSRSAGSRQLNAFSSTDVSVNWMPLDHVAGLIYFHLRDVYLRCRQVHMQTEAVLQDPLRWLHCLDQQRATITFAPNFAYGLVNDQAHRIRSLHLDLSCVRAVLNGAEAIVARTARRFMMLLEPFGLPPSAMQPAWGMSETSSGVTYADRFSLSTSSDDDPFVEVGRPIPGISLRIVDTGNRNIAEGAVGRLQVRGSTVMDGYFRSAEATRAAFTPDGWFDTGDLGMIVDGRLTITGREKDVVIINSVKYYCHAIESAVEALDEIEPSYTAACAIRPAGANTDSVAIFFHPRTEVGWSLSEILKRIRLEVSAKFGIAPEYLLPLAREAIPKSSLGKIQRSELGRRLMGGEYNDISKSVQRLMAAPNTIPDWFFRKVWHPGRSVTGTRRLPAGAVVLVFMDRDGLGADLHRRLVAEGTTCLTVDAGHAFAMAGALAYSINPSRQNDYTTLFEQLRERNLVPTHIAQFWGYGPCVNASWPAGVDAAQELGVLSAMRLAKTLVALELTRPVRMIFVGSKVQRVKSCDAVACEESLVLGLLKSIPQELPAVQCRHVDVDTTDAGCVAGWIVDEMCTPRSEREVAYRDGQRFVACLEKVDVTAEPASEPAIAADGFYLITGGTGGIGVLVAELLLEQFQTKLLLVGRSELEGDRKQAVERLRRSGEIAYESVDVCDADRLGELVNQYEARWGRRLRGVFHLAGAYREQPVRDEDAASFLAVLRPKTTGTIVVHRLLAERGGGLLVCASSLAGFFGGAMIGAYSSASGFQDAFAEQHDGRAGVACRSVGWSNWDGVGQSRALQVRDLPRSRGYEPMPPRHALRSLLVALSRRDPALIIGLDGDHPHIRRYRRDDVGTTDRLRVYYAATGALSPGQTPDSLKLDDEFGTTSRPEFVRLAEMPLTPSGDVSLDTLNRIAEGAAGALRAGPRTDPERRLADVWKRVLAVPYVSLSDNFFDLGGDSLLAARLLGEIREVFSRDVSLREVFDAATLEDLARVVEAAAPSSTAHIPLSSSAPPVSAERLLERLDEIGEDEMDRLLQQFANEGEVG